MSANFTLQDLLEVTEYFGLPSPALVEKDYYVTKALAAITAIDTGDIRLVFSGGTALGRAHKLTQRMSEDIDLKITSSKTITREALRTLRDNITNALLVAGFVFDPNNQDHRLSRNNTKYTLYRLPYQALTSGHGVLRPEIQIETAVWPVRLATVDREIKSFYAEANQHSPEVVAIPCVAVAETAAEKFVALTRRAASELGVHAEDRDKTLVRHIYDLKTIQAHHDFDETISLIKEIMLADAKAYGGQHPPYRENPLEETRKALDAFRRDPYYKSIYDEMQRDMVHGSKIEFLDGLDLLQQIFTALKF